ncbi:MAG: type I restriction enzyme HsdR N-terminal domain-containing protein [Solidesulfovibrio sp.]|uniref:type I restriction enzyme HsdR N-terminal domain-containing protein n=1 Tax=Solidesulfovibrio sp. TaxID=2910990 RepID=UPI003159760D
MHEESLGNVIRDYLTGEDIAETSYEEFRQALARLLVEEKGYPRERLTPKVGVCFPVDGAQYTRMIDLAAWDAQGRPLLFVIFCSGEPGSYVREALAAARVYRAEGRPGGVPLVLVTDTRDAVLLEAATGRELGRGMRAVPTWQGAMDLGAPAPDLPEEALARERRILFAYSEFLSGGCCQGACRPRARP